MESIENNKDSIKQIKDIVSNIPCNVDTLTKCYYIYYMLGKIIHEDPRLQIGDLKYKKENFDNKVDKDFYGICRSFSRLYSELINTYVKDANCKVYYVDENTNVPSHADCILTVDNKSYFINLIGDIAKIQANMKLSFFGSAEVLEAHQRAKEDKGFANSMYFKYYKKILQENPNINVISRKQLEQMDKTLCFGYLQKNPLCPDEKIIYTNDIINILAKDLNKQDMTSFEKVNYLLNNLDKYVPNLKNMKKYDAFNLYMQIQNRIFPLLNISNLRLNCYTSLLKDTNLDCNDRFVAFLKIKDKNTSFYFLNDMNLFKEVSLDFVKDVFDNIDFSNKRFPKYFLNDHNFNDER